MLHRWTRQTCRFVISTALCIAAAGACAPEGGTTTGTGGKGTTTGSGGSGSGGNVTASGGSGTGTGGAIGTGGVSTGGASPTGGNTATGGAGGIAAGGRTGTGGQTGTGGTAGSAGRAGTGGAAGAGGTAGKPGGTGGAAGQTGTGGAGGGVAVTKCKSTGTVTGAFYVDSAAGNDTNDGATPATAWKTLTKVNAATFQPGSALCFKGGGSWTGQLAPKGSGSAAAPNVIDQYDTGNKPKIAAGASDLQAVLLQNVQYWEINNLEVTNDKGAPGDYRGIAIRGQDVGALNHIYIRNSFVHNVTGQVYWIGGDSADDKAPWVKFQTGWDASKRTGGIVVEVESQSNTKTWFNDVVIENNVVQDTSFGGIVFKQFEGTVGWGVRASKTDTKFTPHTNIVIRNNYLSQTGTQYGCNTIYVTGAQHVLIERNVTKDAGTSAIEAYNSDDVRIQYNETFGTTAKAGGADSNGIDADRATTGAIIQYNYVHDNGDGILLCQFAFGDSIVRYNVIVNNKRHGINLHSDSSTTNQTYNNLIFIDGISSGNLIASSGGADLLTSPYSIRNNILHSTRSAALVSSGSGTTYTNNLFSGVAAVGSAAQTGAAMFVNSASRPSGTQAGPALSGLAGLQVTKSSLAINNGVVISNNGGVDFWGNPLYTGAPDIGPYEAP